MTKTAREAAVEAGRALVQRGGPYTPDEFAAIAKAAVESNWRKPLDAIDARLQEIALKSRLIAPSPLATPPTPFDSKIENAGLMLASTITSRELAQSEMFRAQDELTRLTSLEWTSDGHVTVVREAARDSTPERVEEAEERYREAREAWLRASDNEQRARIGLARLERRRMEVWALARA